MTRDEAIKVLNGILHLNYRNFWDKECDEAIDMSIEALKDRPQGEWIAEDGDLWVCDKCGCVSGYKDNFCHKCGADMRGNTE